MTESNLRVLLVEDGAIASLAEKMKLERLGCTVDVAPNGEEAIELCNKNDYKLILMDIELESFDGFVTTQKIRENLQNKAISPIIIALTSKTDDSLKTKAKEAGMNDFFRKPLTDDKFHHIMAHYFNYEKHGS